VEQDCRRLVEATAARFGRLDILVNNAGIALRKRPQDHTAHDWHLVIDSNLTSAFLCSRAAYPHMTKAGGGKIINIGSILATMSAPFDVAYSASRAASCQMTRALATGWGRERSARCFPA
jgi:2-deoxy-D-gluconate 3-dehydrogenase